MRSHTSLKVTVLALLALAVEAVIGSAPVAAAAPGGRPVDQINHVIVIYYENWSFDGLFGLFPGANGIADAGATVEQVNKDGAPYTTLPQPFLNGQPDPRIPADLPVLPFDLSRYVPPDAGDQQSAPPLLSGAVPDQRRSDEQVRRLERHRGRPRVAPPVADRWGPGSRVPAIVISPFAKKGFVDHTQYETASVLKFIEKRWRLNPLTQRDAAATDLTNAFDF